MNFITLFAVSILPGLLWVIYFYRMDKLDPEPKGLILRDFLLGMLLVYPASILETPFQSLISSEVSFLTLIFSTFLIVGLVEEGLKALVVYKVHYNHPAFDEPLDGIIYGITVGLGFAAFENFFYTSMFGIQVGLYRAFLTSLAHASFSGIFGYYLGQAKFRNRPKLIRRGLAIAVIYHGFYDFIIIGNYINNWFAVFLLIYFYYYLLKLIKQCRAAGQKS